MKYIVVLLIATASLPFVSIRAQESALSDSVFVRKYLNKKVWIDPVQQNSVLVYSALTPEPIVGTPPPRFTFMTIKAITFDSGARPVLVSCEDNGHRYYFKTGKTWFEECFTLRDPHAKYKGWTERVWKSIDKGTVFVGMTKEQARLSWGDPDDINRTVTRHSTDEQWVYDGYGHGYLYFTNGRLTAIQN